jgi:nucleoside-diphosphate-sugar epimerase
MRLLVLGGSVFLSEAVAVEAQDRGHEVTCVTRGLSGEVPDGVRHVVWDRAAEAPADLAAEPFDAVVDVSRTPSHVRRAVGVWPGAHWVFVSTISVYADHATPDPGTEGPLVDPVEEDADPAAEDAYGGMKVACERLVTGAAERSAVVRPGLIVGPGDRTGRYGYWPERLADGGQVLGPGDPADRVQVVDVRDLAGWLVRIVESGRTGVYDAIGPAVPVGELLAQTAAGVGVDAPDIVWAGHEFLVDQGVEPWMGPGALPLWLPRPEYDGMMTHRHEPAMHAGLTVRPLADTARDTLTWLREHPDGGRTGITREREAELLSVWRALAGRTP